MSEYWVSKKKYFCKYCEIYITDDAPSRQHHENGLRHKGSVERYIRGIYKAGEKRKKDLEEEKREMVRVEQAARAAFAQDISSGLAKASSAPVASTSSAPRKPAPKPSNPFANYSTAEQLGYSDPDAELQQIRKTQGLVGDWQIVNSPTPPTPPVEGAPEAQEEDVKPHITPGTTGDTLGKRPAEKVPEDDTRSFKLRKKTAAIGLGEIYDPGEIIIKPRKREEKVEESNERHPSTNSSTMSSNAASATLIPKWNAIPLKPKEPDSSSAPSAPQSTSVSSTTVKSEEPNDVSLAIPSQASASRWAKVQWDQPIKEEEVAAVTTENPDIKIEEQGTPIKTESDALTQSDQSTTGLFKKRKAPANAGRGRR